MDALLILATILGMVLAFYTECYKPNKRPCNQVPTFHLQATFPINTISQLERDRNWHLLEYVRTRRELNQRTLEERNLSSNGNNSQTFVITWRRAITNLVVHAIENLNLARLHFKNGNLVDTVLAASTSIDNISRALIHCFGAKPDINLGQEEVLRMLMPRIVKSRKEEFQETLGIVAEIANTYNVVKNISSQNVPIKFLDKTITSQILADSKGIVDFYKQIIREQFSTELPDAIFDHHPFSDNRRFTIA